MDEAIASESYQPVLPGAASRAEIEEAIGQYRETRSDGDHRLAMQSLTTALSEFVIAETNSDNPVDKERFREAAKWAANRIDALRHAPNRVGVARNARGLQERIDDPALLEGPGARGELQGMSREAGSLSSQYLLLGDIDEAKKWDDAAKDLQAKADELVPPVRPMPYDVVRPPVRTSRTGSGTGIRDRLNGPDGEGIERRSERMAMRARAEAVVGILNDEHAYSQHVTETSLGSYAPDTRRRVEDAMFGIGDAPDEDMPVYGFFDDGRSSDAASQYGDFVFRMRPEMTSRTTITFDDSLGGNLRPLFIDELPDATDEELHSAGYADGWYYELQVHGGWNLDEVRPVIEHVGGSIPGRGSSFRAANTDDIWRVARAARDKGFIFWIRPPGDPWAEWEDMVREMRAEGIDVRFGGGDSVGGTGMPGPEVGVGGVVESGVIG